jgi:hypothetical protein
MNVLLHVAAGRYKRGSRTRPTRTLLKPSTWPALQAKDVYGPLKVAWKSATGTKVPGRHHSDLGRQISRCLADDVS